MIPTHGFVSEFLEACGTNLAEAKGTCWPRIRARILELKPHLESNLRVKLAEVLAEIVYEAYRTAVVHDIRLDHAVREVHKAHMNDRYRPNMSAALAPIDKTVVTWVER